MEEVMRGYRVRLIGDTAILERCPSGKEDGWIPVCRVRGGASAEVRYHLTLAGEYLRCQDRCERAAKIARSRHDVQAEKEERDLATRYRRAADGALASAMRAALTESEAGYGF